MKVSGIDVGKLRHTFSILDKESGEILAGPIFFNNDKDELLIGMEDTAHYHFHLLKYLLNKGYSIALINPITTDLTRKLQGSISKNDKLDTLTICDVLCSSQKKKNYCVTKIDTFGLYEQRQLTRYHHNLKEEINVYSNRLQ